MVRQWFEKRYFLDVLWKCLIFAFFWKELQKSQSFGQFFVASNLIEKKCKINSNCILIGIVTKFWKELQKSQSFGQFFVASNLIEKKCKINSNCILIGIVTILSRNI